MKLSLFRSVSDPRDYGFTGDATGGNLPSEHAPWKLVDDAIHETGGILATLALSEDIHQVVQRDGFYLLRFAAPTGTAPSGLSTLTRCLSSATVTVESVLQKKDAFP
jgi:hypothetical protein